MEQEQAVNEVNTIASNLWDLLTKPHPKIIGTYKRQQIRLFSGLLLVSIPFFIFATIYTDMTPDPRYIFLAAAFVMLILYILSRTAQAQNVLRFALIALTILPPAIFLFYLDWQPYDLPRLMIWLLVALIAGGMLSRTSTVVVQGISFLFMVFAGIVYKGYSIVNLANHLGTLGIVIVLMIICSYVIESSITQVISKSQDVDKRRWELEVYAQLLRHDLRNDLQAILGSIELAEAFLYINLEIARSHIERCITFSNSMVELLNVFRIHEGLPETNLVDSIVTLASIAEKSYPNLEIDVVYTAKAKEQKLTSSRLMPLVWNNLFRNAAQYCGSNPRVLVNIDFVDDHFIVRVKDNGPGIPDEEKDWLFKRGKKDESGERGLGLYLANVIVNSQEGTIELCEDTSSTGTEFCVKLPVHHLV